MERVVSQVSVILWWVKLLPLARKEKFKWEGRVGHPEKKILFFSVFLFFPLFFSFWSVLSNITNWLSVWIQCRMHSYLTLLMGLVASASPGETSQKLKYFCSFLEEKKKRDVYHFKLAFIIWKRCWLGNIVIDSYWNRRSLWNTFLWTEQIIVSKFQVDIKMFSKMQK